jgi:hypothetical protein
MIYCVWYPSGGFGHFVNAVLTLYGKNFVRPNKSLTFSSNGNSHDLDLVVPKYLHGKWIKKFRFLKDKNYCVLIDNGINNETEMFKDQFVGSTIIKICYSDQSWPVVAKTMIEKAMASCIETELVADAWETDTAWAKREKYFLFLRDHKLRQAWRRSNNSDSEIYIDDLLDYSIFFNKLNLIIGIEPFKELWERWQLANDQYIAPINVAKNIIATVKLNQLQPLDHIQDIWTQAVVYYYIWITFGVEVPHNDYSNWFTNTHDIITMLNNHGVTVDQS